MMDPTPSAAANWWVLFDLMPDAATITRASDGRMLLVNAAAAQMYGHEIGDMLGRTTLELGLFRDPEARAAMLRLLEAEGTFRDHESPFWRGMHEPRIGMFSARRIEFEGEPCLLVIGRDITDLRRAEQSLRESESRYRMLAEATFDIPWQIDLGGRFVHVGQAIAHFGHDPEDLVGTCVFDVLHPDDAPLVRERLEQRRRGEAGERYFRVRLRGVDGEYYTLENNSAPVHDADGRVVGVHGIARDVRDRIEHEQRLFDLAHRDALTGLLNRQGFFNAVEHALARLESDRAGLAFLFVDLDDFKRINDTAGHAAGDACLRGVAEAFHGVLRGSDCAARIGGDEFAVLLTPIDQEQALRVGERIVALFEALGGAGSDCPLPVTASVGVYMAQPGDRADRLLANADEAMYRAKAEGKNRVRLFPADRRG